MNTKQIRIAVLLMKRVASQHVNVPREAVTVAANKSFGTE